VKVALYAVRTERGLAVEERLEHTYTFAVMGRKGGRPYRKVCGEAVVPAGVSDKEALDLASLFDPPPAGWARRLVGHEVVWGRLRFSFEDAPGEEW
jgi:hypothetical protein